MLDESLIPADTIQRIERAIATKDLPAVVKLMLEGRDVPTVRAGFRGEGGLWDYKRDVPHGASSSENAWACVAADLLAFYNAKGGIIIFGMSDDFAFSGATQRYDNKAFNDRLRRYIGDLFWVDFSREFIQHDQQYLGVAVVSARGPLIGRFQSDAPKINGSVLFQKGGAALRVNDSTRILSRAEADDLARRNEMPALFDIYAVNEPHFRILAPDYQQFVRREQPCLAVLQALEKPRVAVASVLGVGGVGKTALATWATLEVFRAGKFDYIVSITAKDRELTANMGISPLNPTLTDFDSLLNSIADVMGFPELREIAIAEKEREIRNLIEGEKVLLFVDNLETVSDERIVAFLDDLPEAVRAIVTSRKPKVRQSIQPIDVGPLLEGEIDAFIVSLAGIHGFGHVKSLTAAQRREIGKATDGIPLAIRWIIGRARNTEQVMHHAADLARSGRHSEELLEFSFRRLFDEMSATERDILLLLSLLQKPLPREAILVGCGQDPRASDAIDELKETALIQQFFDPDLNDFTFTVIPITRKFGVSELDRQIDLQNKLRNRMSDYYFAKDVKNEDERTLIRALRAGKQGSEQTLIDLAIASERRGDYDSAERLYDDAIRRNPKSWRALWKAAELYRHVRENFTRALSLYAQCTSCLPARGRERGMILREYGILIRRSGAPDALQTATGLLEQALREIPDDGVALFTLATLYEDRGMTLRITELLTPHMDHRVPATRDKVRPLLVEALRRSGNQLAALELENRFAHRSGRNPQRS